MGSLAWDDISGPARLVVVRGGAERPAVLDQDNQDLLRRVYPAWYSFLLSDPHPNIQGAAFTLTGETAGAAANSRLVSVRSIGRLNPLVRPLYATTSAFWDHQEAQFRRQVERGAIFDPESFEAPWFERWLEVHSVLVAAEARGLPPILHLALLSYTSALCRHELEFTIPELVRAAEGVIALPRGQGQKEFAARALKLDPDLRGHPYLDSDVEKLLLDLYELRNRCVHGKVPFIELQAQGEQGVDRAAKLSFAAVHLARTALLTGLRTPNPAAFTDRDSLEAAWEQKRFPP
jgi:hypothetical protein